MGKSRGSVDRGEDEVELLGFGIPPGVPGRPGGFTLRDELPLIDPGLLAEVADHRGPLGVSADVADIQVVEVAEEAGETSNSGELGSTRVRGLAGVAEGVEGDTAVGVQELRCEIEAGERIRRRGRTDFRDDVPGSGQGGNGGRDRASDSRSGRDDAWTISLGWERQCATLPSLVIKPIRSFLPWTSVTWSSRQVIGWTV